MHVAELDDLVYLLFRQDGVIAVRQARRFLTDPAIRHRVASGRWQRLDRRVLLTNTGPVGPDQRRWWAVLAGGRGALLAGPTATELYGLRPAATLAVHLLVPARRQVVAPPPAVVIHRTGVLPPSDVHRLALPVRTTPARSIVDTAQWAASDDVARSVIAAGFQRGLVTREEILAVLGRLPRARRRALIARTADDAAGGSHSLAELDYLRHNRRLRLPEPTRQAARTDRAGRRRYLDVLYERWQVHVEIDGAQHLDADATWADMRRHNDLWVAGITVLRFPAWLVREHPNEVFAQVRAALLAHGWRPSHRS
jgi:very-short-patch-repair endonuclease